MWATLITEIGVVVLSSTHQMTPQTSTQPQVVNVHNGGNHEHVQQFDEIVSTQQQWQYATSCYYLPKTCAPTPITKSTKSTTKFQHWFGNN